jgi:hypothetical protein
MSGSRQCRYTRDYCSQGKGWSSETGACRGKRRCSLLLLSAHRPHSPHAAEAPGSAQPVSAWLTPVTVA